MSFLWNAVKSLLDTLWSSLGLANKQGSLLVLGLDNAGKTTLLYTLRTGDIRSFPPTDRPDQNTFTLSSSSVGGGVGSGGITFTAWDLGGHEAVRHLWEDYVSDSVSAVLFLIDAADSERLEEAGYELDALIGEGMLKGLPVAVLLNKCDLPEALSTEEICQRIEFDRLCREQWCTEDTGKSLMTLYRISVLKGEGYQEAFRWISGFLK
jgi:GTP-binding protein SAR1